MNAPVNVMGQRFGRLVVTGEGPKVCVTETRPWGIRTVLCKCDCGTENFQVIMSNLRSGKQASCGCLLSESTTARNKTEKLVHGHRHHELYQTWVGIRQRCNNPKNPNFRGYGGRGIKVSPRWEDLATFIQDVEAEIGPRPEGMSLDRKDNDGNYEPGNVQWTTPTGQLLNRRSVHVLTERIIELEARVRELESALAEARADSPH